MKFFLSDLKHFQLFLLYFIFAVILFTSSLIFDLSWIKGSLASLINPIEWVFDETFSLFSQTKKKFQEKNILQNRIQFLENLIINYEYQLSNIADAKLKLQTYQKALEQKDQISIQSIFTKVEKNLQFKNPYITIKKGYLQGVREGQGVVGFHNGKKILVGIVKEVHPFDSRVITPLNPDFRLAVFVPRLGQQGVLVGNRDKIIIQYLNKKTNLKPKVGDEVFSSFDSSLLMGGILVGKISKIDDRDITASSYYIEAQLALDFILDYVFLIQKPQKERLNN